MLTSLMVMLPHTDGLEHTSVPTSGSYFLLVTPSKLRSLMSEMVRLEGYCYGRVVSNGLISAVDRAGTVTKEEGKRTCWQSVRFFCP